MEIIDLISSSPPRSTTIVPVPKESRVVSDVFDLGSDDFDITGGLDFSIDQPAKRRRISPALSGSIKSNIPSPQNSVLDLSSEPDALPDLAQVISMTSRPSVLRSVSVTAHDRVGADVEQFSFSSSAPEPIRKRAPQTVHVLDELSEFDDFLQDRMQDSSTNFEQAGRTQKPADLSAIGNARTNLKSVSTKASSTGAKSIVASSTKSAKISMPDLDRSERFMKAAKAVVDDIFDSSQPGPSSKTTSRSSKKTEEAKQDKALEKAASKAAKDAEKELEKERKKQEKEVKKQEKQRAADIAEANKSKTNKKNSTPEMVLLMPTTLQKKSLGNQVEEYMKQLDIELVYMEDDIEEVDLSATTNAITSFGSVIRWRRKVTAEYDEDQEEWHPLPVPRVSKEDHIIVYFKAEDFVKLAIIGTSPATDSMVVKDVSEKTMKANLDTHVSALRTRYPKCRPIYLIEGLTAWNKRSINAKNRAYTAAVRAQPDLTSTTTEPPTSSQPRRRKKTSDTVLDLTTVTEETTEELLLHLQMHHQPLQIHHTTSATTSASQISTFTQHLSTRPYRLAAQNANLSSASFCMTTGQIRTGSTPNETWINMLQEINRVTPSMAYGITGAGYKNPTELVQGFRKHGREMLEDVRKSVNKDGAWSDRKLGIMVSKRVHKVFMGLDPEARDGIA